MNLNEAIARSWAERLAAETEGLDLTDADDRAVYRQRVGSAAEMTRVTSLCETIGILGGSPGMRSRCAAVRELARLGIEAAS